MLKNKNQNQSSLTPDRAKINEKIKEKFVKRVEQLKLKVYVDRLEM